MFVQSSFRLLKEMGNLRRDPAVTAVTNWYPLGQHLQFLGRNPSGTPYPMGHWGCCFLKGSGWPLGPWKWGSIKMCTPYIWSPLLKLHMSQGHGAIGSSIMTHSQTISKHRQIYIANVFTSFVFFRDQLLVGKTDNMFAIFCHIRI